MAGLAIVLLFVLMVAAPCLVAMRNSRHIDDVDEFDVEEIAAPIPVEVLEAADRAKSDSLQTKAVQAEIEAVMAEDRAHRAHWEALTAAARAAALRADAAAEAARAASRAADRAVMAAEVDFEGHYLPESHPSLDFPRAPITRRRAA
jgi:hypothetical protein